MENPNSNIGQTDLDFLLYHGWKLIGIDLVLSPDGRIQTHEISKVAKFYRVKLELQKKIKIKV